jgi:hypothetical protein
VGATLRTAQVERAQRRYRWRLVFSGRGTARDRPWHDLERAVPGTQLVETWRAGAFYLVKGTR